MFLSAAIPDQVALHALAIAIASRTDTRVVTRTDSSESRLGVMEVAVLATTLVSFLLVGELGAPESRPHEELEDRAVAGADRGAQIGAGE